MRERLRKLLKEADSEACKIVQNRFPSDVRTVWELLADQLLAKDVVPVVRCKDCKHKESVLCPMSATYEDYPWHDTKDDDFCSYGERREGE